MARNLPDSSGDAKAQLKRLRDHFLEASSALESDYWTSEELLKSYDETFARRISWKWQAVVDEISARGLGESLLTGVSEVYDWGCGSGVAGEVFLEKFPVGELRLFDRSGTAMRFSRAKLEALYPGTKVSTADKAQTPTPQSLVLLSHVLNELPGERVRGLLEWLASARALLWVEPGAQKQSRKLSEIRDALFMKGFQAWAPCLHAKKCPALEKPGEWCHFFADPPTEVHHSAFWRTFAGDFGIDLRANPYSFVLLSKAPPPVVTHSARILERPRLLKGSAEMRVCSKEAAYEVWSFDKRSNKDAYKQLEKKSPRWVHNASGAQKISDVVLDP